MTNLDLQHIKRDIWLKIKSFRVSKLEDASISHSLEQLIIDKIDSCMADSQGFIFSDFAYGMITDGIINHIKEKKALYPPVFADVQCSSQFGTITKYTNVYLICPNEREARMALQDNTSGIEVLSHNLMQACKCKYMIMKLDTKGFCLPSNISWYIYQSVFSGLVC